MYVQWRMACGRQSYVKVQARSGFACFGMAVPQALQLEGPPQAGRGVQGQYVYWICMPCPRPETVEATDVQTPADLDRNSFRELVTEGHTTCGVELVETA